MVISFLYPAINSYDVAHILLRLAQTKRPAKHRPASSGQTDEMLHFHYLLFLQSENGVNILDHLIGRLLHLQLGALALVLGEVFSFL